MPLNLRARGALLLATLSLCTTPALANGRFPAAGQIVVAPDDEQRLFVRTTFGMLLSPDAGQHLAWTCEKNVGYGGTQDPAIGLLAGGALLAATFDGLSISHDNACSFAYVGGGLAEQFVIDVATYRADPTIGVAITSSGKADGFFTQVFETTDGGKSWAEAGVPIDKALLAKTLDVAPSRRERVYVSGFEESADAPGGRQGAIYVTDDGGKSWLRHPFDLAGDKAPYIGAVDPANPDRLYVRTDSSERDRLLVSDDAGATFTEVFSIEGSMLGFALSPDGARVAVGGPTGGLWVASSNDLTFSKQSDKKVACLAWAGAGLYACGDGFRDGYVLGRSSDEGATFTPLYERLADLESPLSCPAESGFDDECAAEWTALKARFSSGLGEGGSAGSAGAPPGSEAGGAGASGEATAGQAGGPQQPAATASPADPPADDTGCSTRPGAAHAQLSALVAALLVLARRRAARGAR